MTTVTMTDAPKALLDLIHQASESHEPVHIEANGTTAVLIAEQDWRDLQETLYLQAIPGMKEAIIEGLNTPTGECSDKLSW